jgi:hypothetical protein
VARLGRQYVRKLDQPVKVGPYTVTHELSLPYQEKTGEPLELWILPQLQAAIDALPADNMMFFVTPQGKPLSAKRLGSFFRESCLKVGLTPEVCDGSGQPRVCLRTGSARGWARGWRSLRRSTGFLRCRTSRSPPSLGTPTRGRSAFTLKLPTSGDSGEQRCARC